MIAIEKKIDNVDEQFYPKISFHIDGPKSNRDNIAEYTTNCYGLTVNSD
jgi:hypothetical protein